MLRLVDLRDANDDLLDRLPRPAPADHGPLDAVREIIAAVRLGGDAALRELTLRFDGIDLADPRVDPAAPAAALERIEAGRRRALEAAAASIRSYHQAQRRADIAIDQPGLSVRGLHRPVRRAGCYVPGGRALYPSTVLMTAIPAAVAGVARTAVCVPPGPDGRVPDMVLAAAAVAGVEEVYAVGGAQAIAAMAYGTESIAPVDVIAGPGSAYVALAKQEVAGVVGVASSFAGPSEIVVVGDGSADPEFAAVDLMLQAEHGPDGLAWLVTWDSDYAADVGAAIERLLADAPRRSEIEASFGHSGVVALCRDAEQAMAVSNLIAPEHLELHTADPEALLGLVECAGAVFCGAWTPASLGDYIAGPSHVLPTNGSARFAGALSVGDFTKDIHVVSAEPAGLVEVADHVIALAAAEGLDAHAESVRLRCARLAEACRTVSSHG